MAVYIKVDTRLFKNTTTFNLLLGYKRKENTNNMRETTNPEEELRRITRNNMNHLHKELRKSLDSAFK